MQLDLNTIVTWSAGILAGGANGELGLSGISIDTRTIKEGELFVALKGENFNGEEFVDKAFSAGAAAAIVTDGQRLKERPGVVVADALEALGRIAHCYRWGGRLIPWIAVTGSNGKSTTRRMIAHILGSKGSVCEPQKNFNNLVGLPVTLLSNTEENDYGVVEMGTSAPGEIARLTDIAEPTIAVVTNVGPAHLAGLGTVENVAREKAAAFSRLPNDGLAIFPSQGEFSQILSDAARNVKKQTFAIEAHADMVAENVSFTEKGIAFTVRDVKFSLPLLGRHNVNNCLAALLAVEHLGVTLEEASAVLANIAPLPERLERIDTPHFILLNDCYNANPASFHAAVRALMSIDAPRRVAIIGDMFELGDNSQSFHSEMGRWISQMGVDVILAVGKETLALAESAHSLNAKQVVRHFRSVQSLMGHLKEQVESGDLILVKGSRGMRLERVVKALKVLDK